MCNLFSLLLQNKIYAYCLLHLGSATTIQSDGTMIHIMCGVHRFTMEGVVVTRTIFLQGRTVSDAVKVDTTHQSLKKSLERVRLLISPRPCVTFCNMLVSYVWELLAPHPTPKLEHHPLSAVYTCLFNIFTATLCN
jgi:hypothetical protein